MELSVVEQRYRAVLAVGRGEQKTVVVAQFGVSRQTLYTWVTRYARDGLAWPGLVDRSQRPVSCPHRAPGARSELDASKMVHSALVRSVNTFPFASPWPGINPR